MTDQTTPVQFQADVQPVPAQEPAVSSETGQGKTPEYITREEAQRLAEAAAEAAFRKAQGLNDKQAARINARVDELLKSYTAVTGKQPSPEEQSRARQEAERQVSSSPAAAPEIAADQINARAAELYQKAGLTVDEGDPEAKTVDMSSPEKFLSSLQAALDAKRARTQPKQQANPITAAPILGTGGGATNPVRNITDPNELLRMGLGIKR